MRARMTYASTTVKQRLLARAGLEVEREGEVSDFALRLQQTWAETTYGYLGTTVFTSFLEVEKEDDVADCGCNYGDDVHYK
jgi:hypothetical protein